MLFDTLTSNCARNQTKSLHTIYGLDIILLLSLCDNGLIAHHCSIKSPVGYENFWLEVKVSSGCSMWLWPSFE